MPFDANLNLASLVLGAAVAFIATGSGNGSLRRSTYRALITAASFLESGVVIWRHRADPGRSVANGASANGASANGASVNDTQVAGIGADRPARLLALSLVAFGVAQLHDLAYWTLTLAGQRPAYALVWFTLVDLVWLAAIAIATGAIAVGDQREASALALAEQERAFRQMIEHSSDITAVFDAERRVRYLSPSAQRVLGWESDVVGRSGLEFVHPDDQTMLAERIRAPEAPAAPFVLRVRTRGGRWLRLEAVSRRVPDEQGREIVIVNARDVSEREHLETSLREAQKLESVGRLAGRLVPASITLRVEAAQDALHALIDPTQLEQVVLKLVVNARDAIGESGAGEGHVTLAVRERALAEDEEAGMAPGRCIAITVQDTGIGIPDAVRPHVFEPFFTTKAQGDGTGLALATSYGIVRQAGGCLRFDSTVGAGTTFEVLLPRAEGEPEAVESAPTTPAPARGEVVLVAEDDAAVRALEVRATHRSACSSCPATPATPTSSARCRSVRASCRSRSRPTSWCGWCRRWRGRGVRAQANTLQIERPRFDVRTAPTLVAHVRPKASHNARHVQR